MLPEDKLSLGLRQLDLISKKDLKNALERCRNVENESLEESLFFLGLVDYAKIGKVYAEYFKLPYYPIFHQGPEKESLKLIPSELARRLEIIPVRIKENKLLLVASQPDNQKISVEIHNNAGSFEIIPLTASSVEIADAFRHHYLKEEINRENRGISLPSDFKIIDFEIGRETGETQTADHHHQEGKSAAGGKRVILIEPDHRLRHAIATLLQYERYQVAAVIDENEAINELGYREAAYILKRRVFHSRGQALDNFLKTYDKPVEIRYFGSFGGILLNEELSSEEIFRNYLATVKILLESSLKDCPEVLEQCRKSSHYARLLAGTAGLKRKNQEALLLAIYLKEISRQQQTEDSLKAGDLDLLPLSPYPDAAVLLKEIEDCFGLAEIIEMINHPAAQSPTESRIISLLLWFLDNFGKSTERAIDPNEFRKKYRDRQDSIIDSNLAENLLQIIMHEQHLTGQARSSGSLLIVDPSFERDHRELYERLINESYEIKFAANSEQAFLAVKRLKPELIISEIRQDNYDGINFCGRIKRGSNSPAFIFFSSEERDEQISSALLAGADDFISKDGSPQVTFLKITRLVKAKRESRGTPASSGGVSGSLEEMGFMETIQILANREKDALITLRNQQKVKAEVYLHHGDIIQAVCGEREGENAIYELLTWKEGFFQVTTPETLPTRNVFGSTEAIMLEGCRLMDESSRDAEEPADGEWQLSLSEE